MSSEPYIQPDFGNIVQNNYITLAVATAVLYDYILTFSRELDYIWCRPWTWVSTLFVVVRYVGLCYVMAGAFRWSIISTGTLTDSSVFILGAVEIWAFIVFLSAADLMMILRVYAMWNRSRTILYILLFIYVLQTFVAAAFDGICSVLLAQSVDLAYCGADAPVTFQIYLTPLRFVLSAALVIFAVSQALKQSFEMYKATQQWQSNRYMQKMVGDGILYFVVNMLYQMIGVFSRTAMTRKTIIPSILTTVYLCTTLYTLIPRFIIGIRELYDRDIRGRFHIDTGFGMQSRSNPSPDTTISAIVFMDGRQGDTDNSDDLELGRVHGSGLNEDSSIESRE